jgi:hypothetical protein
LAIRSTAASSRANRLEAVATLGAAAETTEVAAPEATEAATAAPRAIAGTPMHGYKATREAAMAVQHASQGHGSPRLAGFRQGLNEIGYVEGRICSRHI